MSNHGHSHLARVMESWAKIEGMFRFEVVDLGAMGILAKCVGRLLVIESHYEEGGADPIFKVFDAGNDKYVGDPTESPMVVVNFVLHELLQARINEGRRVHPAVRY